MQPAPTAGPSGPTPVDSVLHGAGRFAAESIPALESYLQQQVDGKTAYHFEANLALLKLYGLHPKRRDVAKTASALILALMHLPNTDFLLLSYLIPEKTLTEEPIVSISRMAQQLELLKLKEFWAETTSATVKPVLDLFPRFATEIRLFILGVLSATYQTITKEALCAALNITDAQLKDLPAHTAWKDNGATITFPITEENQAKPKKITETITFEQLSKVLNTLNH